MAIWQPSLNSFSFVLVWIGLFCVNQSVQANQFHVELSSAQQTQLANKIEQRETAGKDENLTYWSEHEAFPSFGIGHFIWFPEDSKVSFQQTFPELIRYLSTKSIPPDWVTNLSPFILPWQTRQQFYANFEGRKLSQLRGWLKQTKQLQAEFIFQRFLTQVNKAKSTLDLSQQRSVEKQLKRLTDSSEGLFAIIDYANFKGVGNNKLEVYQDGDKHLGWGLIDVLLAMHDTSENSLNNFVQSAKFVLKRRANLSEQQTEKRWLKGWYHRLDSYLK